MSNDEFLKHIELTSCNVKCPTCNTVWTSSLDSQAFNCMLCNTKLDPQLYVIVDSEKEIQ